MPRLRPRLAAALACALATLLLSFSLSARSAQTTHLAAAIHSAAALLAAARLHVPSGRAQLAREATLRTRVPAPRASEHGLGGDRRGAAETRGGSPAPPGMCPGAVVESGGGAGGGGSGGNGEGGPNDGGANDNGNAADGTADAGGASGGENADCGTASHPVDVGTGRAFTHPIVDFELPGPLPLRFERSASSQAAGIDTGLGPSWSHTLGWQIEERRTKLRIWNNFGVYVDFPLLEVGQKHLGKWGWVVAREHWGYMVDKDDGCWRMFSAKRPRTNVWLLTAIEDRNRNRIELTYADEGARLLEVKDSAGRIIKVKTDDVGHILTFSVLNAVSQGQWVTLVEYTYDDKRRLVRAKDPDGFSSKYAYDADGRFTLDQAKDGLAFHFFYDSLGRCIESYGDYPDRGGVDPSLVDVPKTLHDGGPLRGIHHCRFEYIDGVTFVHDSTQTRTFYPNKHGLLDKREEGGAVTRSVYRDDGHRMGVEDPCGGIVAYERDPRGRITKVTDQLGRVTTIERDSHGLPIRIVDAAGGETTLERDGAGNLVLLRDALGGITAYKRDSRGLATEVMEPTGGVTRAAYDAHGNRSSVTQADGGVWQYTHDGLGRRLATKDPLGAVTAYSYSPRGDLTSLRDAVGGVTRYAYDGEHHLTQITSPQQFVSRLDWGGYHKLVQRTDANSHIVRLGYNVEGELTHVWNERKELHRLHYDSAGRFVGEDTFDGRHLRYRNDACARPVRVVDERRQQTELEYDLAGQLVGRKGHTGAEDAFTYSHLGDLVAAMSSSAEVTFERDAIGRIVREEQHVGDETHTVDVRYDPAGQRIGRKTSLGHVEQVVRDAMGNRTRSDLDGHVVEHKADFLGRDVRRELAAGGAIESGFDPMGRLAQRRVLKPTAGATTQAGSPAWVGPQRGDVTVEKTFRYSWDGELIEAVDKDRGATEYRYDPVGQLLAMVPAAAQSALAGGVASPGGQAAELFRYDPTGNIYEDGPGAETRVYGKGNRLLRKGNTDYVWDPDGNLVEKHTRDPEKGIDELWRYAWNDAGLMASATGPELHLEFAYDSFARRLEKRVYRRGTSKVAGLPAPPRGELLRRTRFVWDGDVLVHELREEAAAAGDPIVEERTYWFEDGEFEPWAHREQRRNDVGRERGGWFHYVNDPIGTPERLVAEDGTVAAEYRRRAWGEMEALSGARATTPIRLQGQYADEETGLRYNRWRYFDGTGRMVSNDQLGLRGGIHSYAFAKSPTGWIDPFGLHNATARLTHPDGRVEELGTFPSRNPCPGARIRDSEREVLRSLEGRKDLAGTTLGMFGDAHSCRSCVEAETEFASRPGNEGMSITYTSVGNGDSSLMTLGIGPNAPPGSLGPEAYNEERDRRQESGRRGGRRP
jgi:RHS repeat-associated protein